MEQETSYYFGSDLDHCLDHLYPGCHIILGWILMIFLGYVRNGKGRSGKRKKLFNFASYLDHYLDLLDP